MMMNRRRLLAGLLVCPICATNARAADGAHWDYEGHGGADRWAELDPGFKACAVGVEMSEDERMRAGKSGAASGVRALRGGQPALRVHKHR